jgi:hypothetical protein
LSVSLSLFCSNQFIHSFIFCYCYFLDCYFGLHLGEIIQQLLAKGYAVRATVRTIANAQDLAAKFPAVTLYEADLLKKGWRCGIVVYE